MSRARDVIRGRAALPRFRRHRLVLAALLGTLAAVRPASASPPVEIHGRLVLELTDAGAAALGRGTLDVPVPPGGESLDPGLAPLFTSRTGPLSRFAVLTYRAERAAGRPDLPGENRAWIEAASSSPLVTSAESDLALRVSAFPDDPYFLGDGVPAQFHLRNPGGLSLQAVRAWPFVPAGEDVVVAIVDSGVDWNHPDLGGPSPPGGVIWINRIEASGVPDVDDDANGQVDDVIGWDFVHLDFSPGGGANPAGGEDSLDPDPDPSDFAGHGTQVSGLVTAITDNGIGLAAGSPPARIMPVRVGWKGIDGSAYVLMSFCAQGIEYAARNGAQVVNCSFDSANLDGLGAAVDLAVSTYGVVVVASAGNEGKSTSGIQYLGMRPDVLAVAGILESGTKASASNYGGWVSLAAFYRGMPTTSFDSGTGSSTYFVNPSGGTSFAAPQVAAQAALLRAIDPSADAAAVRSVIESTGRDLSDVDPVYAGLLGGGLADYAAAAQAMGGGWDRGLRVRGLTPTGSPPDGFAALSDTALHLIQGESGAAGAIPEPGAAAGTRQPVLLERAGESPLLVWEDGASLRAVDLDGAPTPGWPIALPAGAGQPVAASSVPEGPQRLMVPHGTGVLVAGPAGEVDTTTLSVPLGSLAAGEPDADSVRVLAGVDPSGTLRVWTESPSVPATPAVPSLPPVHPSVVIGEFAGPGLGEVAALDDRTSAGGMRTLYFVSGNGASVDSVSVALGRVAWLSLAGFASGLRLEAVAVDSAGSLRLVSRSGTIRELEIGRPLAGEVLCADLDGDFESDLIALCEDGTLLAWDRNLVPLRGFPRRFPDGFREGPAVVDGSLARFVVAADTAGTLWSLPAGTPGTPAPWPAARGGPERNGFLGFARATPVEPQVVLTWDRQAGGALRVCWESTGLEGYLGFRLVASPLESIVWSGAGGEAGCAAVAGGAGLEAVRFEGWRWGGDWITLARLPVPSPPGLVLGVPIPNPFRAETRMAWSGAAGKVRIGVYDVRGRLILDEAGTGPGGAFTWPGLDRTGRPVPRGVYFIRVSDGRETVTRRVIRLP